MKVHDIHDTNCTLILIAINPMAVHEFGANTIIRRCLIPFTREAATLVVHRRKLMLSSRDEFMLLTIGPLILRYEQARFVIISYHGWRRMSRPYRCTTFE